MVIWKFWELINICLDPGKLKLGRLHTLLIFGLTLRRLELLVSCVLKVTCLEFCWTNYTVHWDVLFKWKVGY